MGDMNRVRGGTRSRLLRPGAVALLALSTLATAGGNVYAATGIAERQSAAVTAASTTTTTPTPTPTPTPKSPSTTDKAPATKPDSRPTAPPAASQPKPPPKTPAQKAAEDKLAGEGAARAKAKSTGKPVPVDVDTTEKTTVVANPDGTFTSATTLNPERVKLNGVWKPIDPALAVAADGAVQPKATSVAMKFSGGGKAPLAVVDDRKGHVLTVTWPSTLPKPTISGETGP
jgi:hypothetical protein